MTRISTKLLAAFVLAAAFLTAAVPIAEACGFCHGDKVAAVYDAAMLAKAKSEGKHVAYAEVTGAVPDNLMTRDTLRRALAAQSAIDKASIRVSSNPAAVAFAFTPKKATAAQLLDQASKKLATQKWTLKILQIVE
jgi:hypothetical protein